jgi:hypothetical protein
MFATSESMKEVKDLSFFVEMYRRFDKQRVSQTKFRRHAYYRICGLNINERFFFLKSRTGWCDCCLPIFNVNKDHFNRNIVLSM